MLIGKFIKSSLVRNILWGLIGNASKQLSQLLAFVLLVRAIGADGFGAFSATLGLAALLSPFVELGSTSLIVRDVHQRGMSLALAVERSIKTSFVAFPVVFFVLIILKILLLPNISWTLVLYVALAELLGNRVIAIFYGLNLARERLWLTTRVEICIGVLRLILAYLLFALHGNVDMWGKLYLLQSALVSSVVILYLRLHLGVRVRLNYASINEIREGLSFAIGSTSQVAYNEVDKIMLARFSSLENTGIFSSATKIVYLTAVFLFSVTGALYPRFFGSKGTDPFKLAFRLIPYTLIYGLFAALIIFLSAPLLAKAFGGGFAQTENALRVLAVLSIINSIHYPLADAFTGSGMQSFRTRMYVLTLAMSVLLNLIMIPKMGWLGAAYSAIISQGILVIALYIKARMRIGVKI